MQLRKMLESRAKGLEPKRLDVASKAGLTFRAIQPLLHIPPMNWASDLALLKTAHSPIIYYLKRIVLNYCEYSSTKCMANPSGLAIQCQTLL